jgi:hypothetical protein
MEGCGSPAATKHMTADERSFKSFYYWDEGGKIYSIVGIGITMFASLFIYATAGFGLRFSKRD